MSWIVEASICPRMLALLFNIVRRATRTIDTQRLKLKARFGEVARTSDQNAALRGSALNERHRRRISAEVHDGPAQARALAPLRLDSLSRGIAMGRGEWEMKVIRGALTDAMREIWEISRGLSLPQIVAAGAHARDRIA